VDLFENAERCWNAVAIAHHIFAGLDALFDEPAPNTTQLVIAGHLASGINGEDIQKGLCHLPQFSAG